MSASNNKKKRAAPAQTPISITQPNIIHSLLDSYDFLASNEYSEKTIGLQAFLLRKGVGDINFSDIIDDSERRNRQGQTASCVTILEDKRTSLPEIEASIEKCMMLTRLISYIKEHETQFTGLLSDVRLEMQYNMTDAQVDKTSPNFQKRVNDFYARKLAQEKRRLFFFNHRELGEPANLVYLQNRTTEQLNYLLTRKTDSKSNQIQQEFDTIFKTSFLIVTQPHSGVNPITIYERRRPGEYTAKISVTIISLLNDFIEQHPNLIELVDIEPSLHPISPHYKLAEPQTISWKPCQIQTELAGRSRTFLCAELTSITIEQSSKTDTRVRFAQLLHSLKFAIKIHFHSTEIKSPIFEYALDSLQFGIGAHNNQIPQLLTRVLLEDIRYFTKSPYNDVKTIHDFITRYFIHRAGVYPKEYVKAYLEQELFKASNQRSNFKASEDIYLDFLVNFVFQVEFMAKHPILSMFHDDGLFLSICNSERAAEAIVQSSETGWPVIELRFNSIRIDYSAISAQQGSNRTTRLQPCAVRVDIYNGRTNKLQNRTFDSSVLASDISKFVSSTESPSASRIRILSNFDDPSNEKQYLSFTDFSRYHHPRLQQICKSDDKYKPVTDLVENVTDGGFDEELLDSLNLTPTILPSPYSIEPFSVTQNSQLDFDQNSDSNSMHEYMTIPYDNNNTNYASPTPTNFTSPPTPQQQQQSVPLQNNQEAVLQQIIQNNPNLVQQLLRQYQSNNFNNPTSIEAQAQTQIQYQMPSPYSTQIQMTSPQQRPQIQIVQQPIYHQPQMYSQPQPQMQFAPSPQQHHQHYQQQQTTTMFVPQQVMFQQRGQTQPIIHYVPNNSYQPFQPQFVQQTQQMPIYQNQPQDNQPINVNMNMNMSQQQQQQQQQPISIDPTTSNNIDLEQLLAGISASSSSSTTTT